MVTAIVLYWLASYASTRFFEFLLGNADALNTIFAILLFMGIGLIVVASFGNQHNHNGGVRTWGIGLVVFSILAMVMMEVIVPYISTIQFVISVIIAFAGLIIIKSRLMIPMSNRDRLPRWFRWVLRLI